MPSKTGSPKLATKILHGAWLPLFIALAAFTIMITWQRGREIVTARREQREGPLRQFVATLHDGKALIRRAPGTAVFLNRGQETIPPALRANVEHNQVRHQHIVIPSVDTGPVPRVDTGQRLTVDDLGYQDDGIIHVTIRFGYMEPQTSRQRCDCSTPPRPKDNSTSATPPTFLSTIELRSGPDTAWHRGANCLFVATSHITADAAEHYALPRDRTVIMGSHIDV